MPNATLLKSRTLLEPDPVDPPAREVSSAPRRRAPNAPVTVTRAGRRLAGRHARHSRPDARQQWRLSDVVLLSLGVIAIVLGVTVAALASGQPNVAASAEPASPAAVTPGATLARSHLAAESRSPALASATLRAPRARHVAPQRATQPAKRRTRAGSLGSSWIPFWPTSLPWPGYQK